MNRAHVSVETYSPNKESVSEEVIYNWLPEVYWDVLLFTFNNTDEKIRGEG